MADGTRQVSPVARAQVARDLTAGDLRAALAAGWRDFRAHPLYGLVFGGIYVLAGLILYDLLYVRGQMAWLVVAAAGFPLLAPFVAVGLYEVSRRRAAGAPMHWRAVFGVLRGHDDDQILMMGGFVFVGFTFWMILAHGIFAIFMAESGIGTHSLAMLMTGPGLAMLGVGTAVGALMALGFYAITVISLPMLVDREVDFLTAMIVSLATIRNNPRVLILWGMVIAVALVLAMLPLFLGLFVVLPVLGHATFHLYRRAVTFPAAPSSGDPA